MYQNKQAFTPLPNESYYHFFFLFFIFGKTHFFNNCLNYIKNLPHKKYNEITWNL